MFIDCKWVDTRWQWLKYVKILKNVPHVSIIIQIIFRELVGSLLKSLNLKIFKNTFGVCAWRAMHTHQTLCCRVTTIDLLHF